MHIAGMLLHICLAHNLGVWPGNNTARAIRHVGTTPATSTKTAGALWRLGTTPATSMNTTGALRCVGNRCVSTMVCEHYASDFN